MKVVYTAPNFGHHYRYADALNSKGFLHKFISGFPALSPRAKSIELNGKLYRSDVLQTLYIMSLRGRFPDKISSWLAYLAKIEQDHSCRKFIKDCDIFLFYNGSGLNSSRYGKKYGVINIVEAVNSHVEYQEEILEQEHKNLNLPWKPFPKDEKKRRILEYEEADYILLPSEFVKRSFIEKGFPAQKLLKVPYGFNKLKIKEFEKPVKDSFTVLFVGSISVRKGVKYLIEAFKMLQHTNKRLILVGPDADSGFLKDIEITPDITFTGILKGDDLDEAYKSADVFCLPSIEEGLALVLGEALSFGLPIIATLNTGADDIITNEQEGYLVQIRDSHAIWEKLQLLADSPEVLAQIGANSYAKAERLDGWDETGNKLANTLAGLLVKK